MLSELKKEMQAMRNPEKAKLLSGFFKTGKGEYGEGDVFLGIMVPKQRIIAKKYKSLSIDEVQELLLSEVHEHRLVALLILIFKYNSSDEDGKEDIFNFYLKNAKRINNWDLVDLSSHRIVGNYLLGKKRNILYKLAKSSNLWERRISIISTFSFIHKNQFEDTLKISEILVNDSHDLIQKAVGWALREVGKKDQNIEELFLKRYCKTMPRTMLRYAIERFSEDKRKCYLAGNP